MRIRTFSVGVLASAVAAGSGVFISAQSANATDLLAAARTAISGTKLDAVKTLIVEATIQRNVGAARMTSEVEILLDLPAKYLRSDVSTGPMAMPFTMGFDGDKVIRPAHATSMAGGGMMIRMGGGPLPTPEKLDPEQQARMDEQLLRTARADISRLMLGWFATAHPALNARYTYAGEAESPDGKAHVIDATSGDGFKARLFIDQETKLPLMLTYQGPQPRVITAGPMGRGARPGAAYAGERREMTEEERNKARQHQIEELRKQPPEMVELSLFFDEWRDAGGVKFPHSIRRAQGGTTSEEWTVNRVRINPKIDAKKFEG